MRMVATDQLARQVSLDSPPTRIVSVVPSQTELLHYLGLEREVVGITRFCTHPRHWQQEKTKVGGTKRLNLDQIRALAPDLILANKEENTREDLSVLMEEFPIWISDIQSLEGALEMIQQVGRITGREARAGSLAAEISRRFKTLKPGTFTGQQVAYFIWRNPWMVAARDTFIDDMLMRAGFRNRYEGLTRYPVVNPGALTDTLILLSSEPFPFTEKHLAEIGRLAPGCPVRLVEGEPFSWYGSRLLETPAYLESLRGSLPES